MAEKEDDLISLGEARKAKEKREEQKESMTLSPEEEEYLTAFDWDVAIKEESEEERIKILKSRAKTNKENWESEEWGQDFIKNTGFELGSDWANESVGKDKINKIIELTKDIDPGEIRRIEEGFDRFQYKNLEKSIEKASSEDIEQKPNFYRAALEFVLVMYGMKIKDLEL